MIVNVVFDYHNVIFNSRTKSVSEEVVQIIRRLYEEGFELTLFTNSNEEDVKKMDGEKDFLKYFPNQLYLHNSIKPMPEAYNDLRLKIGKSPKEVLIIDDQESNTQVARELGFQAIQYKTPEKLLYRLSMLDLI